MGWNASVIDSWRVVFLIAGDWRDIFNGGGVGVGNCDGTHGDDDDDADDDARENMAVAALTTDVGVRFAAVDRRSDDGQRLSLKSLPRKRADDGGDCGMGPSPLCVLLVRSPSGQYVTSSQCQFILFLS